ncbi:hypothetical protein [Mangrovihabitans endophyticus]|uniref:Sulfotransferase family protein n=1 Tax=Mangrovihabitans endophyticus TaxID=1751298 RepID=A0A8J3C314_9ACTN|nr:hypothetical protein [Mangrovihabitans endophyticus]GGL10179.1 hypothetical protein GCM10012284_51160 [Mangrovihabitans endophyticus]
MARRAYLHIGAPKAGSTYAQHVLWNNRNALKGAGILLPGDRSAHDQAMTDLREVSWRDPRATWTWDRLAAKSREWHGDVIISNEGLGGATAAQAARAVASLRPAEVHIVVAGRDLWRTLPSVWQQGIRSRNIGRFEDWLRTVERGKFETLWENHTPNRMLRRWGDLVSAEQRHLVTLPPPGAPHDVFWHRFAGVVGIPDGLCDLTAPAANASLGAAEIEVLRRVNQALGDRYPHRTPYQEVVKRHLITAVLQRGGNTVRFGVGLDRADWVAELAEQQIKDLRDYPCHIAGDLDDLRPSGMSSTVAPDDLTDAQVLEVAIETIIGLLGQADRLSRRTDASGLARLRGRATRKIGGALRRITRDR